MVPTPARNIRHRLGSYLAPTPGGFIFEPDVMRAARWTQANAEALLPMLPSFGIQPERLTIQHAPACGCCGAYRPADIEWHVRYHHDHTDSALRCARHVDRLPCAIVGCARTFKMTEADHYQVQTICRQHWRLAPKRMRDVVALTRKRGRRLGWPDKLVEQHWRFWEHARRAIERRGDVGGEGHIDIAAIERMFGFGDDE